LVQFIKSHTSIPVLGHADGVCHIYLDEHCDESKAIKLCLDGKLDYPSACNSIETILVHQSIVSSGIADRILRALRKNGIMIFGGPIACNLGLTEQSVKDFHTEYGNLQVSIEIVENVQAAITHIHQYGSGHTECIVTENSLIAEYFLQSIDSACVFHNASTRFADGFRFGLGAEVGISTGKIHARGPVGIEGLLTSKWLLRSSQLVGHIVASNSQSPLKEDPAATWSYTHRQVEVNIEETHNNNSNSNGSS
jgi:delta-1-pyrroline-5-carboxylate synthetase